MTGRHRLRGPRKSAEPAEPHEVRNVKNHMGDGLGDELGDGLDGGSAHSSGHDSRNGPGGDPVGDPEDGAEGGAEGDLTDGPDRDPTNGPDGDPPDGPGSGPADHAGSGSAGDPGSRSTDGPESGPADDLGSGPAGDPGRERGLRSARRAYMAVALVAVAALLAGLGIWAGRSEDPDSAADALPDNAASGELPTGPCAPTDTLIPPCGAWWGAAVPYAEDGSLKDAVHGFEKRIGRKLDLVYNYHDMSGTKLDGELLTPDEQELGKDRLLMLAWESTVWTEPHHENWTETQLGWKNIASGRLDEEILDPQIRRIKAYGKRVFLSFDQETDARIKEGAGTPEEFVAAYRHVRDRFRALGADNVVWVWTVSGYLGSAADMKALYPGDEYVDWIAMDQYNYYQCHGTTDWKDFLRSQRPSYEWLRENISDDKPVMLAEFATAPDADAPLRQRDWYTRIPADVKKLPEVRALVHWNRPTSEKPVCDLTVNEGPGLEGYREAGRNGYFHQPVPPR